MIAKGQNDPTFLISRGSEKDVEGSLHRGAMYSIFVGAGLSVACLGAILWLVGLFG